MHSLVFKKAKEIGTISALNTYIIAYPFSDEAEKANKMAYELEKEQYTDLGFFSFWNTEKKKNKKARLLLLKAKKILDSAIYNDFTDNNGIGIYMVVNRMYDLAKKEFGETDTVLSLLESDKYADFNRIYQNKMDIRKNRKNINYLIDSTHNEFLKRVSSTDYIFTKYKYVDKEMKKYYIEDINKTRQFLIEKDQNKTNQRDNYIQKIVKDKNAFQKLFNKYYDSYRLDKPNVKKIDSNFIKATKNTLKLNENNKNLTAQQKYKDGLKYWNNKDHTKAKALFKEACDEGNMFACANLSVFYRLGFGGEKNYYEAVKYGKMACDKGVTRGCETIALAYLKGRGGINQDIKKAQEFFKKRCETKSNYCKFYNKIKDFKSNEEYNKYLKQKNNNSNQYNTLVKPVKDDNSNRVALANNSIEPNSNSLNSSSVEKFSNNQISLNINWQQKDNWVNISVSAKNLYANAKGGISVSFPDLEYSNRVKLGSKNGVNSFKAYPKGSKIWSKSLNSAMSSKYLLVEGWDKSWKKDDANSINFKVNVKDLKVLRFNVRSVLIKNRHEYILPQSGDIDQQGYYVKQFAIELGNNEEITNNRQSNIKDKIKDFLKNFYKSGEDSFPAKALKFYASNVAQYFGKTNVTKEEILEDKIRYYKKFPTRHYELKDFEIIDTKDLNGKKEYIVNTLISWKVTSAKGKTKTGTSYGLLTLIETDNDFLVKAIKSVGDSSKHKKGQLNQNSNGLYVCYDKKIVNGNYVSYIGCSRESVTCSKVGKYRFGKYPNNSSAKSALNRCMKNKPKFVDKQGLE